MARAEVDAAVGGIEGVVSTERGTSLAGAVIVVCDARGRIVARRSTRDDGRFSVADLPDGPPREWHP